MATLNPERRCDDECCKEICEPCEAERDCMEFECCEFDEELRMPSLLDYDLARDIARGK